MTEREFRAPGLKPKPPAGAEPSPERQIAFRMGISAESRAAAFLVAKGYRILARRWRSPVGEIDIVAARRHTVIFVEVKARAKLDDAAESITPRQQQRIVAAAEAWLATHPQFTFTDMRLDAVLVVPGKMPKHIESAFEA